MEMRETSRRSTGTHFVDIHEVHDEEEEEVDDEFVGQGDHKPAKTDDKQEKRLRKPTKPTKRPNRDFSRQVSLETGFSKLNGETKTLSRSGNSFGGFGSSHRIGLPEGRNNKGDFRMFRTKSNLVSQNSKLPLRKESGLIDHNNMSGPLNEPLDQSVPAGRYFAALRGPELDEVKDSEDILLPKDETWPFLLRFPIGCFGICLGLSSQAILWRALSMSPATSFLHVTPLVNLAIWLLAVTALVAVSATYALKCAFYLEAVKREYFHPVRVNFFFAPWVACMFLAIGLPHRIGARLHPSLWCAFAGPVILLDLKIYGQWLSGGKRRLSKVANPSSHLSVVGNFVGAVLAAEVGWAEAGKFLWAVGFAHYLVVFVTLYQRLPTSEALPKELHPVYSMFIATPAAASIAWGAIYGEFDGLARTCFFIALFLYSSLVVRINFFRGFRFSIAWWSYTFPMTTASIATIKYAEEVPCVVSRGLALALSFMSSTMVFVLLVSTVFHAFVWKTLFPNDLAIAITTKKQGKERKSVKRTYDIRRWANMGKNGSEGKGSEGDKEKLFDKRAYLPLPPPPAAAMRVVVPLQGIVQGHGGLFLCSVIPCALFYFLQLYLKISEGGGDSRRMVLFSSVWLRTGSVFLTNSKDLIVFAILHAHFLCVIVLLLCVR
ncbi:Guard cell S-type anion channel SLAC1 [Striga hermonthica]|uniref:Guard cell S-type anion channel SLAC1 n=1 Tax=Striga hermonthica TaxID=68872 RepID=A0A9N7RKK1_STRHE|nr:Guard cell S-type anion channel SLAC1 [Striga hermonthica]